MELLIPILGVLTGMVVPIAVFVWLYFDSKNKRDSVIEIAKNLDNPEQVEKLMAIFDERKKEPIDYRRGGLITMFVGIGIFFLGYVALGNKTEKASNLPQTITRTQKITLSRRLNRLQSLCGIRCHSSHAWRPRDWRVLRYDRRGEP